MQNFYESSLIDCRAHGMPSRQIVKIENFNQGYIAAIFALVTEK